MFTPDLVRVPAPELTPDQWMTVLEFEHGGAVAFDAARAEA